MAEERKKYDKEFKLKVVEVSFARGNVKEGLLYHTTVIDLFD